MVTHSNKYWVVETMPLCGGNYSGYGIDLSNLHVIKKMCRSYNNMNFAINYVGFAN